MLLWKLLFYRYSTITTYDIHFTLNLQFKSSTKKYLFKNIIILYDVLIRF